MTRPRLGDRELGEPALLHRLGGVGELAAASTVTRFGGARRGPAGAGPRPPRGPRGRSRSAGRGRTRAGSGRARSDSGSRRSVPPPGRAPRVGSRARDDACGSQRPRPRRRERAPIWGFAQRARRGRPRRPSSRHGRRRSRPASRGFGPNVRPETRRRTVGWAPGPWGETRRTHPKSTCRANRMALPDASHDRPAPPHQLDLRPPGDLHPLQGAARGPRGDERVGRAAGPPGVRSRPPDPAGPRVPRAGDPGSSARSPRRTWRAAAPARTTTPTPVETVVSVRADRDGTFKSPVGLVAFRSDRPDGRREERCRKLCSPATGR